MTRYRRLSAAFLLVVLSFSLDISAISIPVCRGTFPQAINAKGETTGYCVDSIAVAHGFVRTSGGSITVFEAPGAGQYQREGTFAVDVNDTGTVIGYYVDTKRVHHGFIRTANGTINTLDAPGAGTDLRPPLMMGHPELTTGQGTIALSINDSGTIAGYFYNSSNFRHGFVRDKLGAFTVFEVSDEVGTVPVSINDAGIITGYYQDHEKVIRGASGALHGFIRQPDGTLTKFDAPGATTRPGEGTDPEVIDQHGNILGGYGLGNNASFVRDALGTITRFTIPDGGSDSTNDANHIQEIAACYFGGEAVVRTQGRQIPRFALPGSVTFARGRYHGTICSAVSPATQVGVYEEAHHLRGFVRNADGSLVKFDVPCEDKAIVITSVSPLVAGSTKFLTINGKRFGSGDPSKNHYGRIVIQDDGPSRGCGIIPGDHNSLHVVRWDDRKIQVDGFTWPSKDVCPFHPGDSVSVGVWNADTDAGPAYFDLKVGSNAKDLKPPTIESVTTVYPGGNGTFLIKGHGFGSQPTDFDSEYLTIWNQTNSWLARRAGTPQIPGDTFEPITVKIGRWTPSEIEVKGFAGAYGKQHWTLNGGDQIKIQVWNPQTGVEAPEFVATVADRGPGMALPRITSITPLTTAANQTIVIKGEGFGAETPKEEHVTPHLEIFDGTANWIAGHGSHNNGSSVKLNVLSWTDTQIEIHGFLGFGNRHLSLGDKVTIKVWNAQTGAGPASDTMTLVTTPSLEN